MTLLWNVYHKTTHLLADKLVVSTSCSLMHTIVDLVNETKLDSEIKSWMAFAAQKLIEVNALAKALAGQKDEVQSFILRGRPNCYGKISHNVSFKFLRQDVLLRLNLFSVGEYTSENMK